MTPLRVVGVVVVSLLVVCAFVVLFAGNGTPVAHSGAITELKANKSYSHIPTYDDLGIQTPYSPVEYPYKDVTTSYLEAYPPFLIGATWGVNNGIGVQNTSAEWALANGNAAVYEDTDGDCIGDGDLITRTQSYAAAQIIFKTGSDMSSTSEPLQLYPFDAVAIKFSWQLVLNSVDVDDFEFTLTDGSTKNPYALNVSPDSDDDEEFTITSYQQYADTTYGTDGDWSQGNPTTAGLEKLTIVGDLILFNGTNYFNVKGAQFTGGNLHFNRGGVLVIATLKSLDPLKNLAEGSDNCTQFDGATYAVTAQTMGGVTQDGVNAFNSDQFDLFDITLEDGSLLSKDKYVGLADIDGDDFTDVCLNITSDEAAQLAYLQMNCDYDPFTKLYGNPCKRFALPHGNAQGFAPCTDTQKQPISKPACPESVIC
jgi:hypothetical protein